MRYSETYVKDLEDKVDILTELVKEHAKSTEVLDWLRSQLQTGAIIRATDKKKPVLVMEDKAVFGNLSLDFGKD